MGKTFLVSGFGRSGTHWLALLADRSPTWSVGHEPGTEVDAGSLRRRFAERSVGGNWGEVNSYCLPALNRVGADKTAVILRCPRQLVVSCLRQGHPFGGLLLNHLNTCLAIIDAAVEGGTRAVSFRDMTARPEYTADLLRWLGVSDVTVSDGDLKARTNASPGSLRWDELTTEKRANVAGVTDWFARKYRDLLY